jgi:hypothetical protein
MTKKSHSRRQRDKRMSVAEINAMPRICAWNGCDETYQGDQPSDWNCLLVFWSPGPIHDLAEINPNFWPRDGVLCPEHSAALEKLLRPIRSDPNGLIDVIDPDQIKPD